MKQFSQDSLQKAYWQGQERYNTVVYNYPGSKEIIKSNQYFYKNESGVTAKTLKKVSREKKSNGRFKSSVQRSKRNLRRLIHANPDLCRFVTLTYADNMTDRDRGFRDFKNFMKRLRYRFPDVKYISVVEYQDRGAVHFHLLINLYIPHKMLEKIWGNGFVFIVLVRSRKKAANYLKKYMSEDFLKHEGGKKLFTRSQNLDLVKKVYYDIIDLERFINSLDLKDVEIFKYNFDDVEGLEVVQVFGSCR